MNTWISRVARHLLKTRTSSSILIRPRPTTATIRRSHSDLDYLQNHVVDRIILPQSYRYNHHLSRNISTGRYKAIEGDMNTGLAATATTDKVEVDQSTTESVGNTDRQKVEGSQPNSSWKEEALDLYENLMKLTKDGEWEKLKSFYRYDREARLFPRAVDIPGKQFEYAFFVNKTRKLLRGVVQFGPWLEGPVGAVHGGAIATVLDSCTGVLIHALGYRCVTVNLNVDYVSFLPLNSVVECEARLDKIEGRKCWLKGELRSIDGKTVHDRATALYLQIPKELENKKKQEAKEKAKSTL